ncbi:sensor histidine kinase [Bosea sp. (in: a-proteobacteria)]|uniref:sensor histidine kinase n=1 Tax=Bosea sp. (in: a-proteobacteria) TaxID=1871050 RepID=UPI0027342E33|nr:PAS domain-containing sensor histidine kinase [Bosea sp. (in: a-proteobacteria)]MDP3410628.1 HWE histidine kinase domain-containing protein [Bosea sp. (in: a-proteobacteria)]
MGDAIRRHDWAATPLGPLAAWPTALKVSVGTMVNSRFPKCLFWGAELISIYNDAYRPMLGAKPEALGRPFAKVWPEVWDDLAPVAEKALAGEASFFEDMPLVVERFGRPEQTWFTFCYSPVRDETGAVVGILDTVIETTGKMKAERDARLLNTELAHRMKNVMAMVSAVASQTFRASTSLQQAQATFGERIATLGQAHDILTQSSWSGAPIGHVIRSALAPHGIEPARLSVSGPALELGADQALTLALAINELITNAVKYGALSTEGGRVDLGWEAGLADNAQPFRLDWVESGGPPVNPPGRMGFGSRLIERIVAQTFGGEARLDYAPDGFRYSLVTTMDKMVPREADRH